MKKLAIALFLLSAAALAQVAVAPFRSPRVTFTDANGLPLANGCVFTYQGGTSTPLATYADSTGSVQNSNPVILDSTGSANIWPGPSAYKYVVWSAGGTNCASGTQEWSIDQVPGNEFLNGVISSATITGGTIDNTPIGATTPNIGNFTTLTATDPIVDIRTFGTPQTCEPAGSGHPDDTAAMNAAIQTSGITIMLPRGGDCIVSGQLTSAAPFRLNLNGGTLTLNGRGTDICGIGTPTGQIVLSGSGGQHEIYNGTIQSGVQTLSGTPSCIINDSASATTLYLHDVKLIGANISTFEYGVWGPAASVENIIIERSVFQQLNVDVYSAGMISLRDNTFGSLTQGGPGIQGVNAQQFLSERNNYEGGPAINVGANSNNCASRNDYFVGGAPVYWAEFDCFGSEVSADFMQGGTDQLVQQGGSLTASGNYFLSGGLCIENQTGFQLTAESNFCSGYTTEGMLDNGGNSTFLSNTFNASTAVWGIVLASSNSTAKNNQFVLSGGAVGVKCIGSGPYEISGNSSTDATCANWVTNLQVPASFAPATAAGVGASVSCAATCTSSSGIVNLTTGSSGTATGAIITVTWGSTLSRTGVCAFQGLNTNSISLDPFQTLPTTTGLEISVTNAPAVSSTYSFAYVCN